jgi:folate-dependent phosphoribosylglycinamide formyltransferase PurN
LPKRVVVLAEPESLVLPNLVARLAQLHPLVAIIEIPPPPRRVMLKRAWDAFGLAGVSSLIASEAFARVVDRVSKRRFYSLRKVAHGLDIPYHRVSGLHAPDCTDAIQQFRPDVVFTQVSRRVGPELLSLATFWNKHCSLLPSYAGVFPVFWALLDEQEQLGVTIHEMDEGFDTGTVLQQAAVPATAQTFWSAYHALYDLAAPLVDRALRGDVLSASSPPWEVEPSYRSFPGPAARGSFKAAGRRFGVPFRLHAPITQPAPETASATN